MKLPIKLICPKAKVRKDNTNIIFIQYCHSSEKRILLSTSIAIPYKYWIASKEQISKTLPIEFGDSVELNKELFVKSRNIENLIQTLKNEEANFDLQKLKNYDLNNIEKSINKVKIKTQTKVTESDFWKHYDDFYLAKLQSISKGSCRSISTVKQRLLAFEKYTNTIITFKEIDYNFYEQLLDYLSNHHFVNNKDNNIIGLKINSVGKTITIFKTFLREMMRKKIIPFLSIDDFKSKQEDVDNIYLNTDEIQRIINLELSGKPHLDKSRDLFIIGCFTSLRFSDYNNIKQEDFRDGMLYLKQQKTQTTVIIPVRKELEKIVFEKYKMKLPKVCSVKYNIYVKQICALAKIDEPIKITHKRGGLNIEEIRPKYNWVSSHTCRRTFCTNEYLAGTPTDLIMNISGHTSEKTFRKYIKVDKFQKANLIQRIWENRKN